MQALALGFFAGVRAFFGGVAFVIGTPRTWGWAFVPVAVATLLFGVLAAFGLHYAADVAASTLHAPDAGVLASTGVWLLRFVLAIVALVVSFVVAVSLAQPLSGFALDRLVKLQHAALGGRPLVDPPALESFGRSLRVSLTALAVGLPVLGVLAVVTLIFPPAAIVTVPLKLVVAGVLLAYDLLDAPLSLRGYGVRERVAFLRANTAAVLGLGLSASALMLVPGIALVLLPWGVAGATRLVHEAESRA